MARLLNANGIGTTVIEQDPDQIDLLRRFGHTVHYGDATRLDLLRAAGAAEARLLIAALGDAEATLRVVDLAREPFPHLPLVVRAMRQPHLSGMTNPPCANCTRSGADQANCCRGCCRPATTSIA